MTYLQIDSGPPPDNDDCSNAFVIFDNTVVSNFLWTTDGAPEPGLCGPPGNVFADGWYVFTAPCTGQGSATFDGDFGSRIIVYSGDCNDQTALGCSGDTGCGPSTATVSFPVQAGHEYLLRVGGCKDGDFGTGLLSVGCSTVQVPALGAAGILALTACLLLAGIFTLRRHRAAYAPVGTGGEPGH